MVRKAAFLRWGKSKDETVYSFDSVLNAGKSAADDPMAVAVAVLKARNGGIDKMLGATLSFASLSERPKYRQMLERGLSELDKLLTRDSLL